MFLNYFIEVQLIYVLTSAVQQSDSLIHIYIYILKKILFIMVYHRILNVVLCAAQ